MISFTLFLIGAFPTDSNHSPSQRDRLRQTTKDREYAGLHRDTQAHRCTHKNSQTPSEHTFRHPLTETLRCAQKQTSLHPLGPSQPQTMDVQFKTQAHSDAWAPTGTGRSERRITEGDKRNGDQKLGSEKTDLPGSTLHPG